MRKRTLRFSALAWLKLQWFCHAGDTEIGGFGISDPKDLFYVQDFITIPQDTNAIRVAFRDNGVVDFTEAMVDLGKQPREFLRIWCHTHPGSSPEPSCTDESTFERVFGSCDWAIMFILSRTCNVYCRLRVGNDPHIEVELPVKVDWRSWPADSLDMTDRIAGWESEFNQNVFPEVWLSMSDPPPLVALPQVGDRVQYVEKTTTTTTGFLDQQRHDDGLGIEDDMWDREDNRRSAYEEEWEQYLREEDIREVHAKMRAAANERIDSDSRQLPTA